ncbi:MAG: hypothetical protein ACHP9Z_12280 [Streptosporangiales bacterium]
MNSSDPLTTVPVRRSQLDELRQVALDLSRAEGRRVTHAEVIGRLLAARRQTPRTTRRGVPGRS